MTDDPSPFYVCAACGLKFLSGWSEAEALAELARRFPGVDVKDCVPLCDDCAEIARARMRAEGIEIE